MIFNLFAKTFLTDFIGSYDKVELHPDSLFTGFEDPIKNIPAMTDPAATMEAILARIKSKRDSSFYFISATKENINNYWLPLYFYCLGMLDIPNTGRYIGGEAKGILTASMKQEKLFKKELKEVFGFHITNINEPEFSLLCKVVDDKKYLIDANYMLANNLEPTKYSIIYKDFLEEIPAEYFINMVGKNSIADKKYNNFRIYDIDLAYLKVRQYIFNSNQEKNHTAKRVLDIFDKENKLRFDEKLILYPELEDELKKLFKEFGFDEYLPLFTHNMKEYIDLNTTMGYSAMGLFKYNKFLADYIKKIGYEVPTKLGKKK